MIELNRNLVTTARMITGKLDALSQMFPDDHKIEVDTITISNDGTTPPIVVLSDGFNDIAKV